MKPQDLKTTRLAKGWTQEETARRLGVSQSYLAMLENGSRRLSARLVRKARNVFGLPPTVLPTTETGQVPLGKDAAETLARHLAALGYPGFSYLRPRCWKRNPSEVLLTALMQNDLEARLVEALPWLLFRYWNLDKHWLVQQAKLLDLQNRLGFVVSLARQLAERTSSPSPRLEALKGLEVDLEQSRLAREDSLCKALKPTEEQWLRENRPEKAKHWNLLTDWRPEILPYAV